MARGYTTEGGSPLPRALVRGSGAVARMAGAVGVAPRVPPLREFNERGGRVGAAHGGWGGGFFYNFYLRSFGLSDFSGGRVEIVEKSVDNSVFSWYNADRRQGSENSDLHAVSPTAPGDLLVSGFVGCVEHQYPSEKVGFFWCFDPSSLPPRRAAPGGKITLIFFSLYGCPRRSLIYLI